MKKVIVGMSGGIDSSVAAMLLKNQGFEVVGVSLKHLSDEAIKNKNKTCCSLDDINDARIVCFALGIPHYVINVEKEFTKEVIQEFLREYKLGYTPNPCVICNEKVKIKTLINLSKQLGFDYVATGHYAVKSNEGFMFLSESIKDQTYMLYRIPKEDLDIMIFPLGNMDKTQVRKLAKENNITTHDKKDSQGICFAPDGYEKYLSSHLDLKEGNFVDKNKNILGKHKGYALYTLGQRRHLGIKSPHPLFITNIDSKTNTITVGSFEDLLIDTIEVFNYIFHKNLNDILEKELIARPRFSSRGLSGKLFIAYDKLFFKYNEKNAQNAKGQHIVFYLNNELIGGGEIK